MDALFRAVRTEASPAIWSRGVELVRSGAVVVAKKSSEEIELQVGEAGNIAAPTVYLYPEDAEWSCGCSSPDDPCMHVAAAVIALRQGATGSATASPTVAAPAVAEVGYRFETRPGGLALVRELVVQGERRPLKGTLTQAAKEGSLRLVTRQDDLQLEALVGHELGGIIPRHKVAKLLPLLRDRRDLVLDDKSVSIGEPTSALVAIVEEAAAGFRLRLEQDPKVKDVFPNGIVRAGSVLCALRAPALSEREVQELRRGRLYQGPEVGSLVGEMLPRLEADMPLRIDTNRLPGRKSVRARLLFDTQRVGDKLDVLVTLVYGDPPLARVDGDELVSLGRGALPARDKRHEALLRKELKDRFDIEPGERLRLDPEAAIELATGLRDANATTFSTHGAPWQSFYRAPRLEPRLAYGEGASFDVYFEPEAASPTGTPKGRASAAAVLSAWERGESLAPLLEGGFGPIPSAFLAEHGARLRDLLEAREAGGADKGLATALLPDVARLAESLGEAPPPAFDALRALVGDFAGLPEAALPSDLRASLRDYQTTGVRWLSFLRTAGLGALLADDMGLGKTLQTICTIAGRTLVVAPTSVVHNWQKELARFRPSLRVALYHGTGRGLDAKADVTLTTYALLRLDADVLSRESWEMVVLDEAQAIKNPESQVARAAYGLRAGFRVALTGTPVENRLEDLWSQMHFLAPGFLGSREMFRERTVRPIADGDAGAAQRLRERIRPFILRRKKTEVERELPPRTDVVLSCELTDEERGVYDSVRAATKDELVRKLQAGASTLAVLEALLRLRQAACHPALVPGQGRFAAQASSKIALLRETLETAVEEGHKALVFSQWTSLLDLVEPSLRESGLGFLRLDGSTRDRGAVVDRFQAAEGPPILLISLKAGGTGLNLTAADNVFLLDPWWNPAVEEQAADRAHRIGQDKPVLVQRLVAEGTVEERILELQEKKRELAEAALGEAGAAASITRAELLALLD